MATRTLNFSDYIIHHFEFTPGLYTSGGVVRDVSSIFSELDCVTLSYKVKSSANGVLSNAIVPDSPTAGKFTIKFYVGVTANEAVVGLDLSGNTLHCVCYGKGV